MLRYKEFWFALLLLLLAVLPSLAIPSIDGWGRFAVAVNHKNIHHNAAMDASIYQDTTRPLFIMVGITCAWFLLFGSWEGLLLVRKIQRHAPAKFSTWIFVFALLPAVLLLSVAAFKYMPH